MKKQLRAHYTITFILEGEFIAPDGILQALAKKYKIERITGLFMDSKDIIVLKNKKK